MKYIITISLIIIFYLPGICQNKICDDKKMYMDFINALINLEQSNGFVDISTFDMSERKTHAQVDKKTNLLTNRRNVYRKYKDCVLTVGKLTKSDSLQMYYDITACCFMINKEGVCVTNFHFFDRSNGMEECGYAVRDNNFNIYLVTEVLAVNRDSDIVVFKIDTKGKNLSTVDFANNPSIGDEVHLVSNPQKQYGHYSKGIISRRYKNLMNGSERMSISADFAIGSSGAPILNNKGKVVGMVGGTFPLVGPNTTQMVIKEIIPANNIKQLINSK